ncbi:hypothetical protein [Pontiella sulfatireligans]|uniref:Uncharacterized protein n=1 Tax=Pontiella sulfatireligans TaxID=2750658 RepID=A0A6C2URX9_9BACT|nr:hypothetical protein [Pontiella sulfatireligans]VGO21686.1 hypothetical protein SCARR_03760 [Pontiella sulfatireligans]
MKKYIAALIILAACGSVFSGQVGLPMERIALPPVEGSQLVCIWDDTAGQWVGAFEDYDHAGVYDFQVPEWGKWYWIGLWDEAAGEYVFGKWIGHFIVD